MFLLGNRQNFHYFNWKAYILLHKRACKVVRKLSFALMRSLVKCLQCSRNIFRKKDFLFGPDGSQGKALDNLKDCLFHFVICLFISLIFIALIENVYQFKLRSYPNLTL